MAADSELQVGVGFEFPLVPVIRRTVTLVPASRAKPRMMFASAVLLSLEITTTVSSCTPRIVRKIMLC